MSKQLRVAAIVPPIVIPDGALEVLKWTALLLMTGDHVNKYLFNGTLPFLFEAGRLAMPLFVVVLAYNLARPGAYVRGVYTRTIVRLGGCAAVATPPFIALGSVYGGWYPLNILFTLLTFTVAAFLLDPDGGGGVQRLACAGIVVLLGGAVVEFWWPAVVLGLAVWWFCKSSSVMACFVAIVAGAGLYGINGNFWALVALPMIIISSYFDIKVPRLRWVFYIYYPVHLLLLLLIRIPMAKAGYLFF